MVVIIIVLIIIPLIVIIIVLIIVIVIVVDVILAINVIIRQSVSEVQKLQFGRKQGKPCGKKLSGTLIGKCAHMLLHWKMLGCPFRFFRPLASGLMLLYRREEA